MKLRIDESVCTGHGRCYSLVPELFEPDDRGYGVVTVDPVPESQRAPRHDGGAELSGAGDLPRRVRPVVSSGTTSTEEGGCRGS